MRRRPIHGRGFTVVELMVAMAIAGILISLIFAVYTKMSSAYQAQSRVTDVIQNLRAGQAHLVRELRMAGNQLPTPDYQRQVTAVDFAAPPAGPIATAPFFVSRPTYTETRPAWGFRVAPTIVPPGQAHATPAEARLQPIYITNGGGMEPDQVRFYWADTGIAAKVDDSQPATVGFPVGEQTIVLADPTSSGTVAADTFSANDLIVVVNSENEEISMDVTGTAAVETFEISATQACLLRVTAAAGNIITTGPADVFNTLNTPHCDEVRARHTADIARTAAPRADTMVYKFEGRSYRIDPARREIGVLQMNDSGELVNTTWTDLGIGFTNLQIASRWFEAGRTTANLDAAFETTADLERNWYSGENQEFPDPDVSATRRPDWAVMISLALTLESRSYASVDSAGTATINYGANGNHTPFSDMAPITLPDADLRYAEPHTFRYSTVVVDFRNMARSR